MTATTEVNDMLDWLVIGGGLHGVHLSLSLLVRGEVPRERLRVLDPQPDLLDRWRRCTTNVGMEFMRSPSVHHIDGPAFSMVQFAREREHHPDTRFVPPYHRPSLALFDAHCRTLLAAAQLEQLHERDSALDLAIHADHVEIVTRGRPLRARRVVLAFGAGDQPHWPSWALELRERGVAIDHVFAEGFSSEALPAWNHALVIGGGISAIQLALTLAERQPGAVTLLTRHPLRKAQFDSDPGWLGPRFLTGFARIADWSQRRRVIDEARQRGSAPRDVLVALRRACRAGRVILREDEVVRARLDHSLGPELWLRDGASIHADRVVLATGFERRRPGRWLDATIERAGLPLAACGYPIVDAALRWHPRIHVSGPLAELELGPAARNIAGARMAAQRIVPARRSRP
ncbi:FAD/NAD(P)-binding protein [Nannocystaceae bacterium ST9]